LYAAVGCAVLELDLRQARPHPHTKTLSLCVHVSHSGTHAPVQASDGGAASCSVVRRYAHSAEEVNHIAVSPRGDLLAAADDAGEVALINLDKHVKTRTLARQHTNIASCVAWRPDRTAELLSAGLDARAVLWDASTGKARRVRNAPHMAGAAVRASHTHTRAMRMCVRVC
jgi:WD40 repeat protein